MVFSSTDSPTCFTSLFCTALYVSTLSDSPSIAENPPAVNTTWVLDSGASDHMCNNRACFTEIYPLLGSIEIKFGDDKSTNARYYGVVSVNGLSLTALFIPNFRFSLFSLCQLDFVGFEARFARGRCLLTRSFEGRQESLSASLQNGLYLLDPESSLNYDALTTTTNTWHRRLGHLSYDYLCRIPQLSLGSRSGSPERPCITCIESKQRRQVLRDPVERARRPFELLHSDSCGRMPPSLSGAQYYIVFIDDFSRWTFTYFLRSKNSQECTAAFQELLAFLTAHHQQYPVARFRCDNGKGEYDNDLFKGLLWERGILFQPSPPRTQHKNGVSERMIQTLNSRARAMMIDARLPLGFWAELVNTATYLVCRSPTSALGHRSPFEVLHSALARGPGVCQRNVGSDFRPSIGHLRRVGCLAYHRIPDVDVGDRTALKFGPRAKRCMMLGYTDSSKLWRLWDFSGNGGRGRLFVSSDVVFLEDQNAVSGDEPFVLESGIFSVEDCSQDGDVVMDMALDSSSNPAGGTAACVDDTSGGEVVVPQPALSADIEAMASDEGLSSVLPESLSVSPAPSVEVEPGDASGLVAALILSLTMECSPGCSRSFIVSLGNLD